MFKPANYNSLSSTAANPLSILLNKPRHEFTRQDLLRAIKHFGIEYITFHYTALDGHLKELRLPFSDAQTAESILAMGERVDGSSLFAGLIDASVSDLYVVPRYSSAFINPFEPKSLDFVCRFLTSDGNLAAFPPDNILEYAQNRLRTATGYELYALGELEFFLIRPTAKDYELYPTKEQKGYHNAAPFAKNTDIVNEIMHHVQQITGAIKYCHAEVGAISYIRSANPLLAQHAAEQYEVEFRTRPISEMADDLALTRWIIRRVAAKYDMLATFAPKIEENAAGSGLHIHLELMREGVNQMLNTEGTLTTPALQTIGGLVKYAKTLSAFGNTTAASYLRLVPNHEAPTKICWSYSNRSSLIRIPLGWGNVEDLATMVNPQETQHFNYSRGQQTVEFRSPDGSAHVYLLLAGLATAVEWGLTNEKARELAKDTQVKGNIFHNKELADSLESLPKSCCDCAELLRQDRALYDTHGLFPSYMIDYVIKMLEAEDDANLQTEMAKLNEEDHRKVLLQILHRDLYKH